MLYIAKISTKIVLRNALEFNTTAHIETTMQLFCFS